MREKIHDIFVILIILVAIFGFAKTDLFKNSKVNSKLQQEALSICEEYNKIAADDEWQLFTKIVK